MVLAFPRWYDSCGSILSCAIFILREQSQRVYAVSKEGFITEVIDAGSLLLVSDIPAEVGDPSL